MVAIPNFGATSLELGVGATALIATLTGVYFGSIQSGSMQS